MSWLGLFDNAIDLASEAIEDKDKLNALKAKLSEIKEHTYQLELQTQTIPWVDALHKMSRPIISVVTVVTAGIVISLNPELDIMKLLTAIGGGALPAGIYTMIKGRGH